MKVVTKVSGLGRWRGVLAPLVVLWLAASPILGESSEECADCHDSVDDGTGREAPISIVGDSIHGFAECLDCHPGAESEEHVEGGLTPGCADCHEDTVAALAESVHGRDGGAAEWTQGGCASCHGPIHRLVTQSDLASPIHHSRIASTCGACHANPDLAKDFGIRLVQPLAAYEASVHARAVSAGEGGADCSSCHGAHDILPASAATSSVHRENVPATCGTCHAEITAVFQASVHGRAAAHGVQESPVCTDCHGEHRILGPDYQDSPVFATNIPKLTCGRCHGDLRLSEKFGMAGDQVPAYSDSFHGLASRSGSVTVANCSSCHGVHDILPSIDPASHTSEANLAATCGHCHPGAGERFAIGPVHVLPNLREHVSVLWARRGYLGLIFLTIGAMVLHNLLDLYRKSRHPEANVAFVDSAPPERMALGFRVAHALLAVSFVVLAYTGFALKYPEAWWAVPLLRWEGAFGLRGWIHRGAAVVMLGAAVVHVFHMIMDRRARHCIAEMLPRREDWTEVKEKVSFLFGRRLSPPHEPWLGYVEKAEYLAVIWGTVIMAITGFLLWFEEWTLRWLPTWIVDLSTAVHFYEAILATLAILVWHFYAVIFDPVVYPMDMAWLSGRSKRRREAPAKPESRRT